IAVEQDIDLDQVGRVLTVIGVVEGRISLGPGLELIEEVEDDLGQRQPVADLDAVGGQVVHALDRKSTRLNSSHVSISYAVFCLKKKIQKNVPFAVLNFGLNARLLTFV